MVRGLKPRSSLPRTLRTTDNWGAGNHILPTHILLLFPSSSSEMKMNPYASRPEDIPATDSYADLPCYGRYFPRPDGFHVNLEHVNCDSPVSLQYWTTVIDLCDESTMIYPADEGGRDVFALGNIIVKSSHLHKEGEMDYSYADSNEVKAITIARDALEELKIRAPVIYFHGKVCVLGRFARHVCCTLLTHPTRSEAARSSSRKGFRASA